MHLLYASCVGTLLIAILYQVRGLNTIVGLYGETIEVPCNSGAAKPKDHTITKWKYDKGEGVSGDLMVKRNNMNASVIATDEYKSRVSMAENSSLLLSAAKLADQKTFTCMVVADADIKEYPVNVVIHKAPSGLDIFKEAAELEIGKVTKLGRCSAHAANPAANITWFKNNEPLVANGNGIIIAASVQVDPDTGLSTTSSTLEYSAVKGDGDASFTCRAQHAVGAPHVSNALTFTITYPSENIRLRVIPEGPFIEGDNVTLQCVADGNPAPTSFNFHIKGEVVKVQNADTYTMTDVSRDTTGEYKCSLIDNDKLEASTSIAINYLEVNVSLSGNMLKSAGEALSLVVDIHASGETKMSWTKDHVKLHKQPNFDNLTYSDSGRYECDIAMGPLRQKASFELVVQGAPVIKNLWKRRGEDGQHKVLICEAEGSPKPSVSWSVNGTSLDESPFINGKMTHKITVVPTMNLTVSCTVYNELGQATRTINVSSLFEEVRMDKQDQSDNTKQTNLVIGVVVSLLIVTVIIGIISWIYMKKSKQGSWKTGEKENGSSEEEKKLEEKVEENSQKAEV